MTDQNNKTQTDKNKARPLKIKQQSEKSLWLQSCQDQRKNSGDLWWSSWGCSHLLPHPPSSARWFCQEGAGHEDCQSLWSRQMGLMLCGVTGDTHAQQYYHGSDFSDVDQLERLRQHVSQLKSLRRGDKRVPD